MFVSCSFHYPPASSCSFFFFLMIRPPPRSTLFPYPTLFRSSPARSSRDTGPPPRAPPSPPAIPPARSSLHAPPRDRNRIGVRARSPPRIDDPPRSRSEEHTSELQSRSDLVCRLLLEKKKKKT